MYNPTDLLYTQRCANATNILYTQHFLLKIRNSQISSFCYAHKRPSPFFLYIPTKKPSFQRYSMNLLSNSCQQTGKKSENGKKRPTHKPRYRASAKFLSLLRYNLFIGVDKMRIKISLLLCRLGLVLRLWSV